jgi:hypothetical protein
VIDIELGREDHNFISHNCDGSGLKSFDGRTNFPNQIKLVVKTKNKK